jgi:hypothetical protein
MEYANARHVIQRRLLPQQWMRDNIAVSMEDTGRAGMSLGMIVLIIVVLMLLGSVPAWPHSRSWGYGPSGGLGLVLLIIIVLVVLGYI